MGVSFRRPQHKFSKLVERPLALFMGPGQAEKVTVAAQAVFWGCPGKSIKALLPFHGMREVPPTAGLGPPERDPHGPTFHQ
jgi:hypothetical protein